MREVIPMRRTIEELCEFGCISKMKVQGVQAFSTVLPTSEVYEDNQSCLTIATSDAIRPRTKHIGIKYFHFRDQVAKGLIKITKVHTSLNWADILTKPLAHVRFEKLRELLMGW